MADTDSEKRLAELREHYAPKILAQWLHLANSWIGGDSPSQDSPDIPKKRYHLDYASQNGVCQLTLWYGNLPENLSDRAGDRFYENDLRKPLVHINCFIQFRFTMQIYDRYRTFFDADHREFQLTTFEEFVEACENIKTALLKP